MLDDRGGPGALFLADGAALHPLLRVRRRALVSALGDAHAFEPDRETGQIHHDEHVLEAAVFLANEVANRAAVVSVGEYRGGARVNAELVLDRHALHVVAEPKRPIRVDQELGHNEKRDALHTLRRGRRARQHEMDDVIGVVVLTVGDEDLLPVELEAAVRLRHRPSAHRGEVRPRLRLGQVHRAGPFARDHLRQIALFLLRRPA